MLYPLSYGGGHSAGRGPDEGRKAMYQRDHWLDARCGAGDMFVGSILVPCGAGWSARLRGPP